MYELYLAHHGILGQRWGFRRFQNKDGSLTTAGKNRYGDNPRHKDSEARKRAKQRAAALEKARKAKAEKAKFEADRQKALKTGSATEVLKYKNFSTQKELQDAVNRINLERQLSDAAAKEAPKGKPIVDKIVDTASTWRDRTEKGINIWNTIAKIHNSFVDEDDAWQTIGQASVAEAKEKRRKEKQKEMQKEARDKILANFVKENGSFEQVKSSASNMTTADYTKALSRFKERKPQNISQASKDKKAAALKNVLAKGLMAPENAKKMIESEYMSPSMVEEYARILESKQKKDNK